MKLHNLTPAAGSVKKEKGRLGRGEGSGSGGTASKGHKGAKARSGFKSKRAFEGGQMPIQMRLPKRGFKNINQVSYVAINVSRLQEIHDNYGLTDITKVALYNEGIINRGEKVKILGNGELSAKLNVTVDAYSASAKSKIEAAGGTVNA
ncbi:MAG: 50S ribosomal protein L15 [Saprospiraceae bacterium]|jgi:large subunit ribosomal protein L15|nr:50S ribosomal protein L15 [Saprospiraceae bacterium]MBK9565925.1 50S ribosomal protein L15 [Saprospiraceae bacterium]MBP6445574.1 50S ribosomal protein L15 [Saprospiraceae bacterium]